LSVFLIPTKNAAIVPVMLELGLNLNSETNLVHINTTCSHHSLP
jgi:hypothetical protein